MKNRIQLTLVELICILAAFIVMIPFLIILLNSFKDIREAALFGLSLPSEWVFTNYSRVFERADIVRGFKNSFLISGFTVFLIIICASTSAFIIQRRNSILTQRIFIMYIIGLIMPTAIVPTIQLMVDLNINGTYAAVIFYYVAVMLPFAIFLLVGFMKSIPRELDEAAIIDGCNYPRMFFQIIFPLLMPVLITVTIVVMINVWNDFTGPFYLITDTKKWTVVLLIYNFMSQYETDWGLVFAFMTIVISPILIIYILLQRYIIHGLTAGSVKG